MIPARFLSYGGYQALLSGGGNLYAMDPETNQMEVLLNWVDSGVDPGILADCIGGSQERIWYLTSSEAGMVLGVLQRTAAAGASHAGNAECGRWRQRGRGADGADHGAGGGL